MRERIAKTILAVMGWRLTGQAPAARSYIILGVPHTTNWDFFFIFLTSWGFGTQFYWVGKQQLFRFPFGVLLRRLGGLSIDRSGAKNTVAALSEHFAADAQFKLLIPPEGTRRAVDVWKTGFYHVALRAGVPLVLGYVDYQKKETGLGPVIIPSGDYERDMPKVYQFYESVTPKYPRNYRSPGRTSAQVEVS